MGFMGKFLVVSLAIVAAHAKPAPEAYAEAYGYHPEHQNYYVSPVIAAALPKPAASQHHAQDELGQYEYGFNTGNIAKQELKTVDGITRGSYSYVDANGILQTTNYISDDVFGFRVAATNLPQHVVPAAEAPVASPVAPVVASAPVAPVVAAAPAAPVIEVKAAPVETVAPTHVATTPQVIAPTVAYSYLPYALQYGYNAALPEVVAPYAAPVAQAQVVAAAPSAQQVVLTPAVPTTHQFHAQDELGQYQFGYTEPKASRVETKTADGVVTGRYNYIDSNGQVQTVEYIADALGFRVAGTNLPQHHVVAPVHNAELPVPVADTPEVVAAKAAHLKLVQDAKVAQPVVPVVAPVVQEAAPVLEASEPAIIAVPNAMPEETPVAPVQEKVLEPYVPPPVPTFYKAADPAKVAAAVESQLIHTGEYQLGAPVAAVPVAAPVVSQPTVYVSQPQVSVAAPVVAPQVPVVASPAYVTPVANQHHAQDEWGQYQYGYTNEDSTKLEQRLADGSVRGTYSYVDANGIVQRVDYISDALGFRVAATNLPVANPVAAEVPAPVAPVVAPPTVTPVVQEPAVEKAAAGVVLPNGLVHTPAVPVVQSAVPAVSYVNQQVPVAPAAPLTVTSNVAPVPYYLQPSPAPVSQVVHSSLVTPYASQYGYGQINLVPSAPTTSQHHAQSEFGEYNYGYSNVNSAKTETKTIDGVTRGSYTYVDANNILQRVDYIADDLYGFRVAATNLPQAPAPIPVAPVVSQNVADVTDCLIC